MPRIRTVKPDFATSRTVAKISRDARLFFLVLLTHLDDKGRVEYLPKQLAGALFPHDEDVTTADVRRWVEECEAADGMLRVYEAGGHQFLCAPKFNEHQVINRPTPSRLPAPPWEAHEPLTETVTEPEPDPSDTTHGGFSESLTEDSVSDSVNRKVESGNRKLIQQQDARGREGADDEPEPPEPEGKEPECPPWQDHPEALVRDIGESAMRVPKFAVHGHPPLHRLEKLVSDVRQFAPNDDAIRYELELWETYNRENARRGGEKDPVQALRNWYGNKRGTWAVQAKRMQDAGGKRQAPANRPARSLAEVGL